jgi:hypothetical protein
MNIDVTLERLRNDIIKTLKIQGELVAKGQGTGLENLSKQLLILAEEGQKISQQQDILAQQQKILQTLIFEEMEQREESIKDAHKTTLDWVFKKNETQFMNWLKTEKGIYWVRGKVRVPHSNAKVDQELRFEGWKWKVYTYEVHLQP